jgi:PA14 domain
MFNVFRDFSQTTRRITAALALAGVIISCSQTPVTPTSSIEVSDENGVVATTQAIPTNGLKGEYFNNPDFTGTLKTRYDARINSNWGTAVPITGIAATTYSVRWTGQIQVPNSLEYAFHLTSSGSARLMINGKVIVNNWTEHATITNTKLLALQANVKYDIRLDYARYTTQPATLKLEWQRAGQAKQVIPQANLFPTTNIERALAIVQPKASITLDKNTAVTTVNPDKTVLLLASQIGTNNFVMSVLDDTVTIMKTGLQFTKTGNQGTLKNLLTDEQTDLGDVSLYTPTATENRKVLTQKILEVLVGSQRTNVPVVGGSNSSINANSAGARTQGITDDAFCNPFLQPPPSCGPDLCVGQAEKYKEAVCNVAGLPERVIVTAVGVGSFTAGGFLLIIYENIDLIVDPGSLDLPGRLKDYLDCIKRNQDRCVSEIEIIAPKPIEAELGQEGSFDDVIIKNIGKADVPNNKYPVSVSVNLKATASRGASIFFHNPSRLIGPQSEANFNARYKCVTSGVVSETISVTHSATNVANPFEFELRVSCAVPKLSVVPEKLDLVAQIGNSAKGPITIKNAGKGVLSIESYSVTPGVILSISQYPVKNLFKAGESDNLEITGTCGSTVGKLEGTITISSNDPENGGKKDVAVTLECKADDPSVDGIGHIKLVMVDYEKTCADIGYRNVKGFVYHNLDDMAVDWSSGKYRMYGSSRSISGPHYDCGGSGRSLEDIINHYKSEFTATPNGASCVLASKVGTAKVFDYLISCIYAESRQERILMHARDT